MEFDEFEDDQQFDDNDGDDGEQYQGFDYQENESMPDLVTKRDAVIFLVDCNKQIFYKQQQGDGESQFKVILKSIQSFFKSKIIGSVDDQVGVIFYNVNKADNDMGFEGINVVYQLNSPSAEIIKHIPILEEHFERDFGFANVQTPFHEALWQCNSIFTKLQNN